MRICFFGDSFTLGTGDDECLGWVGRLSKHARSKHSDLTTYNLGIRRDTSREVRARWQSEAAVRLANTVDPRVVFAFGNNDAADGVESNARVPLEETLENAEDTLSRAANWLPSLMISPIPQTGSIITDNRIDGICSSLEKLCQRLEVPFLDLREAPREIWQIWRTEAEKGDGAHPNTGGYQALAQHICHSPEWNALVES